MSKPGMPTPIQMKEAKPSYPPTHTHLPGDTGCHIPIDDTSWWPSACWVSDLVSSSEGRRCGLRIGFKVSSGGWLHFGSEP